MHFGDVKYLSKIFLVFFRNLHIEFTLIPYTNEYTDSLNNCINRQFSLKQETLQSEFVPLQKSEQLLPQACSGQRNTPATGLYSVYSPPLIKRRLFYVHMSRVRFLHFFKHFSRYEHIRPLYCKHTKAREKIKRLKLIYKLLSEDLHNFLFHI